MINEWNFGTTPDGQDVRAIEIGDADGIRATVLNYGATLHTLHLPNGRNVVLNLDSMNAYLSDEAYHGRIIGRNANRITDASFEIGTETFQLTANDGTNNLHGGPEGFEAKLWRVTQEDQALILRLNSPDGDQGFPGQVDVTLRVTVNDMTLRLEMEAITTRPTPLNMTWHPYWNLLGKGRIDGHNLHVMAAHLTALEAPVPLPVANTRFDFQTELPIGSVEIDKNYAKAAKTVLSVHDTRLIVTSSLPDIQICTAEHLTIPRAGIALEPQFQPNDIKFKQDSLLSPGEVYRHWIEYEFQSL